MEEKWICDSCGEHMEKGVNYCKTCGKRRPDTPTYTSIPTITPQTAMDSRTFWTSGLRLFAWIGMALTVLLGFCFSLAVGHSTNFFVGVLVFLGSCAAAFVTTAVIMIFLNLAEDISAIRKNSDKKS